MHEIPDLVVSNIVHKMQAGSSETLHMDGSSSIYHPHLDNHKPNSFVERCVQTIKNVQKKVEHSGRDPCLVMLELKNMPISEDLGTP